MKKKVAIIGLGDIAKTVLPELQDKMDLIMVQPEEKDFTLKAAPLIETFEYLNLPKPKRGTNRMKPKKKRKK